MFKTVIFVQTVLKMSRKIRRQFDGIFKSKVVIEALRERKTLREGTASNIVFFSAEDITSAIHLSVIGYATISLMYPIILL